MLGEADRMLKAASTCAARRAAGYENAVQTETIGSAVHVGMPIR